MKPIIDAAQPYVSTIATALFGLLAAVSLSAIGVIKVKVTTYLDARLTAAQREVLHKIAGEAYAYAETVYRDLQAEGKLDKALDYATDQLAQRGISVTSAEVRAAIEAAWLKAQGEAKKVV